MNVSFVQDALRWEISCLIKELDAQIQRPAHQPLEHCLYKSGEEALNIQDWNYSEYMQAAVYLDGNRGGLI